MVVVSHLFLFLGDKFRGRCDSHESHLPLCGTIYFPTAPFFRKPPSPMGPRIDKCGKPFIINVDNLEILWKMWKMNYTYIVQCRDGSLYTGWTNDLKKRIEAHNAGKGAKYTKSRRPVKLLYYEEFDSREEAMRREYEIKHMSRKKKEEVIQLGTGVS